MKRPYDSAWVEPVLADLEAFLTANGLSQSAAAVARAVDVMRRELTGKSSTVREISAFGPHVPDNVIALRPRQIGKCLRRGA